MDNRIDAIYGRQSIDKKDSISIESQFEFCRYELKGGEGKEYKDKGYSGKNIEGSSSKPPSLIDGEANLFKLGAFDRGLKSVESSRER